MRKLLSLGALVAAACASPADDTTASAEAPLSSFDALEQLWNAKKADLTFGAPPVTAGGTFMTFAFWANEGETVQLHVDGTVYFDVRRVQGRDWCKDGGDWSLEATSQTTTVASGRTDVTLTVERSGTHFVVIGAPGAESFNTVRVSSSVRRRPTTKGVRAVSMYNAKTCAVLANGVAKCWGTTEAGWNEQPRPGATMASMGASLAAVPLPTKAVDVDLSGPGAYTTTSFLLDDGSVWSGLEDAPLRPIALAGKAKKVTGTCAWLEDDGVQCWSYDAGTVGAVTHFAKPVKAVSAARGVCALLEGDELACGTGAAAMAPGVALPLEPGEHALGLSVGTFDQCVLTNKAVRCGDFSSGVQKDGYLYRADVPGDVAQFLIEAADRPVIVTTDGRAYAITGGDWQGLGNGVSELTNSRWDATSGELFFQSGHVAHLTGNHSAGRTTQCTIDEAGVVKCAGALNVGQLGLGDCIDRADMRHLGADLPGLQLD